MLEQAFALHQKGQFAEAASLYRKILEQNPQNADALHLLGMIELQNNNALAALGLMDRAIALHPDHPALFYNRGVALHALRRFDEAIASYDLALARIPDYVEALNNRGIALRELKRFTDALDSYDRALAFDPDYPSALTNRGVVLRDMKRFEDALESFNKALALESEYEEALNNRGVVLHELKRFEEALESYDRALKIKPDHAEAHNNRGNTLQALKRFDAALASYARALALAPGNADTLHNHGNALQGLKRFDEALQSYDHALKLRPDHAESLNNRGNTLRELKRLDEALDSYARALALRPDYPSALSNRGNALGELKRFEEALESYDRALKIRPDYLEALHNQGVLLQELRRFDEALATYDRALKIKPDYVEALYSRGMALQELNRFEEAIASYDRALALEPDYENLFGLWLLCKMMICDWHSLTDNFNRLAQKITRGEKASSPFALLSTPASSALQRKCAEIHVGEKYKRIGLLPQFKPRLEHDRIRLGYFSADFRNHAVSQLTAELFERHDRNKFEVIAFSFAAPTTDAMGARLKRTFDRFIEADRLSDLDVALRARELEIDIAIDLNGFTKGNRTNIFAMGAAPIQVNYLGFPGTMAASYIDYLIADPTLIPKDAQQHYLEKIVYLPDTYMANDSKRLIADKRFSKGECGLPENGFVFCCFNNSYKIAPDIFDIWMGLLKTVEGSVLWLSQNNEAARQNLRKEARARGIDPTRLVFASFLANMEDHLARLKLADLFLDTLPYNAHTTASDALWAGVPVLTCLGQTFAGRVAGSLLNAIGLPELVKHSLDAYEAKALELAANPQNMLALKRALEANRLTHPLFDTGRFTRHIESAYESMWTRHRAGLPPEHIHVQPETGSSDTKSN